MILIKDTSYFNTSYLTWLWSANTVTRKASVCFNPVLSSFFIAYCTCKQNDTAAHHCLPHALLRASNNSGTCWKKKERKYTPREKVKLQWRYRRSSRHFSWITYADVVTLRRNDEARRHLGDVEVWERIFLNVHSRTPGKPGKPRNFWIGNQMGVIISF